MNSPIGVFDSGLGGLTVVRQLMKVLPGEDILYFGDTGRVPYGTRSPKTIEKYATEDCRFLMRKQVKMIIAACGTVSTVAPHVLTGCSVPSIGVVKPAADAAVRATRNRRIGVIGTAATIRSGLFHRRISESMPDAAVFTQACPMFVPLVENGWIDREDAITRLTVERYVLPLKEQGIDTLILGCTHFPLLSPVIADVLGENVTLIDSGKEAAIACASLLAQNNLLNPAKQNGKCHFYVSDRADDFTHVAGMFLGKEVSGDVEVVNIEAVEGAASVI